jgi:endonuclease III
MPAIMNKQDLLAKSLKLLEKRFPAPPPAAVAAPARPVLEELLYAVCREGSTPEAADAGFARLKGSFFDWNEVRVSTVSEVAEALHGVPDAGAKAQRVVEILQYVFEMYYSFDLADLDKKGLKQAAKQLARFTGATDFAVAWVTQRALGGHALPLDEPTLRVLRRLRVVEGDADDLEAVRATLEHFVPKAKGPEFTDVFARHAAALCVAGPPDCPHCPLNRDCPTGVENLAKKPEPKPKPKSR